jgi:2-polyprenyl-3-methyl-5-hydroxy-6-metoxy-1,4-benzoquinol methylase
MKKGKNMDALSDKKIIDSWQKNVSPWVKAIKNRQIESRVAVTDHAIIESITSMPGNKVIDIGCGEGWLVRQLSALGFSVTGIDAISELINKAKALGEGSYKHLEYEKMSSQTLNEKYDIAVCNFSLLGKESVEHIFNIIPSILENDGYFVIQTLHPNISCGDLPYIDGWREGTWTGFSDEFSDPPPWYFRTIESWFTLFHHSGLKLNQIKEPINLKTGTATSLIMIGSKMT